MTGSHVNEEQIEAWAAEAEAGCDSDALRRRVRGRPGRGAERMQVVAVRLSAHEIAALDALAARDHISRSEAIRRAPSPSSNSPHENPPRARKHGINDEDATQAAYWSQAVLGPAAVDARN